MNGKKTKDERFRKFGTVSFTATTKVNDFIDHLESGRVTGTFCNVCGERFFPPRSDCFSCLSSDVTWFDVTGVGRLVSYSHLKFAPKGFEKNLPYSIALLDFGEYKIFGQFDESIDLSDLTVGMEMKVVVKRLENGNFSYAFKKA